MKYLYYFSSGFNGTMLGVLLDEAKKKIIDENVHVYFVVCDELLSTCLFNPTGKKSICKLCTKHTKSIIKKTLGENNCTIIDPKGFVSLNSFPEFTFNNVEELKLIEYKDVKIGYASLSTYVHLTRNQNPKINDRSKKYFLNLLNQAVLLTESFQHIIDYIKPDLVATYNGRFNEFRPVYETTLKNKIDIDMYETVRLTDSRWFKVKFRNTLPHNVKKNLWRVEECWNNPDLQSGENSIIARDFFERRRNGQVAGDKVYVGKMKRGELPENWNTAKRNIVIFNSSEDEFVAIGDEYSSLSLFKSQVDGLDFIFNKFQNHSDIHFYLRIHPNLNKVKYKYHTELYKFQEKYTNVTVISPESSINSYDLMDEAEKVVVFGSTMGLEAAYWKKPVILLSCAFYYYANFCYIPKTGSELSSLLEQNLEPIENENILKYGLFYLNKKPIIIDVNEQFKYVDYNPIKVKIFNKSLNGFGYQTLLGSANYKAISMGVNRLIIQLASVSRFQVPLEEE